MGSVLLVSEVVQTVINVGVWVAQLVIGIAIAMFSISLAIRTVNRVTKEIDHEAELARGNLAVAAMMAGVVVAVALVTSSGVVGLTQAITNVGDTADAAEYVRAVVFGVLQLLASLAFASLSIWLAIKMWDRTTKSLNEAEELKKGNVAIGIVLGAVMISIAIVLRQGLSGLAAAISGIGS